MAGRTISFPKGDGSLTHNNRGFIANNVCPERTVWNRTYIKESLADAYEKCFGEAVREYNAGQKRNDRKISNYMKKIENSDNGENVFYENIVQLGTKYDTPVVDDSGNLTEAAKEAIDLLDEYARTFRERNPNLYLYSTPIKSAVEYRASRSRKAAKFHMRLCASELRPASGRGDAASAHRLYSGCGWI